MKLSHPATRIAVAASAVAVGLLISPATANAAESYSNCEAMNADYPHGVGKTGASDSTSGTPVTNFTVNDDVYNANTKRDRDKDGIACEQN